MNLWQVHGKDLSTISPATLDDEQRLEDWVVKDPSILGIDVLLIGRQISTPNRGRIDLLAIDSEAKLVVLELKRDRTPRDVVAQALDYASWIKDLAYDSIEAISSDFLKKPLSDAFDQHFGFPLPASVNASHSVIVLAAELDDSSERIVEYLSEEYGVPVNVLFFTFFKSPAGEFLGRAWLKDPKEFAEHTQSKKQAPWLGYYFVNVGEGFDNRDWEDCAKYGFLSAGHGLIYINAIRSLKKNDQVFAYMKGLGYVGFGTVTQPAVPVGEFIDATTGKKLLDLPLKQPNIADDKDDPAECDWAVAVSWQKCLRREEAKTFKGIFANPNIVCKLRATATVDFLRREFGLS
jgi:hypothetical protein